MKVLNIHERRLYAPLEKVGSLMKSLASKEDRIWPHEAWPKMKLDQGLIEGSSGGHGPIRYFVKRYIENQVIEFQFLKPRGLNGIHRLEILSDQEATIIKHTIDAQATGFTKLTRALGVRPLHDALIEDAFDKVETLISKKPKKISLVTVGPFFKIYSPIESRVMKDNYRIAAGLLCLLTAFLHLAGGQFSLIDPLLSSELSSQIKGELVGVWHMVTVILFYSARVLLKSKNLVGYELVQFLGYSFLLFGMVFILTSLFFGLLTPQFLLLIPIGILALFAVPRRLKQS